MSSHEKKTNSGLSELVSLTKTPEVGSSNRGLEVDIKAVESVFGQPEYTDYYAVVYIIAGPTRKGKSFLLSLFLDFLKRSKEKSINSNQWSNISEKIVKNFEWKRGAIPCTHGINILKQAITFELDEKKIAVFLADSQGMFDHDASEQDQNFLGTFCFLLSSFLIFNVDKGIETPHLTSIHSFATNLRSEEGFIMQRESLMFVVRDWLSVEPAGNSENSDSDDDDDGQDFSYGMDGGGKYFKALIQSNTENKPEQHRLMREYLEHVFGKNISCCLLPHPGNAVGRNSCSLKNLDKNFCREAFKLFQKIENEKKSKIKQMQNHDCKCGELCKAIKDYVLEHGPNLGVADRDSILVGDLKFKLSDEVKKSVDHFNDFVKREDTRKCSYDLIENNLNQKKDPVLEKFKNKVEIHYQLAVVKKWTEELDRVLSQFIRNYIICICADKEYTKAIDKYREWQKNNINNILTKQKKNVSNIQKEEHDTSTPPPRQEERPDTTTPPPSQEERPDTGTPASIFRNSLLKEMKEGISEIAKKNTKETFEQCKKYFERDTNEISAAIKGGTESYSNTVKLTRGLAYSCVLAFNMGAIVTQGYTGIAAAAGIGATTKPALDIVEEHVMQPIFEHKMKSKIDGKSSDSSLALQEFENGEMIVKLSFGDLKFPLEIQKNLRRKT